MEKQSVTQNKQSSTNTFIILTPQGFLTSLYDYVNTKGVKNVMMPN